MSELVTVWYKNPKPDLLKHIDGMEALLKQLRSMDAKIDDSLAIGIVFVFIDVPNLKLVVVAIKTLTDADATWETVRQRLIEEWHRMKKAFTVGESSAAVSVV